VSTGCQLPHFTAGVHFDNKYGSKELAHILESVMQHQTIFALPADLGRRGLLQISTPTEEESKAATAYVGETFVRLGSLLDQPMVA
jgi:hypothetical protein